VSGWEARWFVCLLDSISDDFSRTACDKHAREHISWHLHDAIELILATQGAGLDWTMSDGDERAAMRSRASNELTGTIIEKCSSAAKSMSLCCFRNVQV
jgi:hypothetical protein